MTDKVIVKFINRDGMQLIERKGNKPYYIEMQKSDQLREDIKTRVERHLHTLVTKLIGRSARRGVNFEAVRGVKVDDEKIAYVLLNTLSKSRYLHDHLYMDYILKPLPEEEMYHMRTRLIALHRPKSQLNLFEPHHPYAIIDMIHKIHSSGNVENISISYDFSVLSIDAPMLRKINIMVPMLMKDNKVTFYMTTPDGGCKIVKTTLELGKYYSYEELHGEIHKAIVKYILSA